MKFKFIWVGRTRTAYLAEGIEDYLKRIKRYVQVEVKEVKEEKIKNMPEAITKAKEAERIKTVFKTGEFLIALDERGKQFSTTSLAHFLKKLPQRGYKTLTFFLGGPLGLPPELLKHAHLCLSLSSFTLTHEMARLVLLEQLYRVLTIWHGEEYHK